MLKIRSAQKEAFEAENIKEFRSDMLVRIQGNFPKYSELIGAENLNAAIDYGYQKAKKYNLTTRYEVCLFIDIMVLLGCSFDTDPQLPWIKDILLDEKITEPKSMIDKLFDNVMKYLDTVLGVDNVFPVDSYKKILDISVTDLGSVINKGGEDGIHNSLQFLWPEKYNFAGNDAINNLIVEGRKIAEDHAVFSNECQTFFLFMAFLLGHRFDIDPQFPWAGKIIGHPDLSDEIKLEKLIEASKQMIKTI